MLQSFPPFKCTDFMKCVGELWITLYIWHVMQTSHSLRVMKCTSFSWHVLSYSPFVFWPESIVCCRALKVSSNGKSSPQKLLLLTGEIRCCGQCRYSVSHEKLFCPWFSSTWHFCINRREIMVYIYVHLTNLCVQKCMFCNWNNHFVL
jgi:hypothetical protein